MAETNRRVSGTHRSARKATEAKKELAVATQPQALSNTVEVLWKEIAELSHRYLRALNEIRNQTDPDSDEFSEQWAEIDVTLFTMKLKIRDVLKEMERLEDTWPD